MNEILEAIFIKLNGGLTTPVFDDVPQDKHGFPYVVIDTLDLIEADTDSETGFDGTLQISIHSQQKGKKEIAGIQTEIYNLLHRFKMPDTASFGISTIVQKFSTIALKQDGKTRQSIQRFNILFEPLP